jgi:hypothetical protein
VWLWLSNWWDGVDLWLTQVAFPFQFVLVMVVLLPLCLVVAWAIDRLVDRVSSLLTRVGDTVPAEPEPAEPKPAAPADAPAAEPAAATAAEPTAERHTVDS